jgi:hypothetical protein
MVDCIVQLPVCLGFLCLLPKCLQVHVQISALLTLAVLLTYITAMTCR